MTVKPYDWGNGAILEDHSRRKHKILREYFAQYLNIRCQLPVQSCFRLAIVDGFSGGGRYSCGTPGSPIVFLEEVAKAATDINLGRARQGVGPIQIECLIIFNDSDRNAIELLRGNVTEWHRTTGNVPMLKLKIEYLSQPFEDAYLRIKEILAQGHFRNVVFNLDQCGHSSVHKRTIVDIMQRYPSAEVFYTFAIASLIAFLQQSNPTQVAERLSAFGLEAKATKKLEQQMSRNAWLGSAERIVFDAFQDCAPYVSPFSINNPNGWRYWLIHFANSYRARQVYNDVLHLNSGMQAHFGRAGLNMLSYDPNDDGVALYLFDSTARGSAKEQLLDDIPRMIAGAGDVMPMLSFYESVYNTTPAHADDVHSAIMDNPDLVVLTPNGGERRRPNTITPRDLLKLKSQKSFYPMFFGNGEWGVHGAVSESPGDSCSDDSA